MKYFNSVNEYAKSMEINYFNLFMAVIQTGDCYCGWINFVMCVGR